MPTIPVLAQAAGVLAVLVGLFLLLPLGFALVAAGVLVAAAGVALEVIQGRSAAPQDRRIGSTRKGAV